MSRYLCLSEQYLPRKGGHVIWLHETLRRLGDAHVLTARQPGLPKRETIDGVDVRRIGLDRRWYLRPESLMLYAKLTAAGFARAATARPTAIVAARVLAEGLVAAALGRVLGLPSIIFAHGEEITCWGRPTDPHDNRQHTATAKRRLLWAAYHRATRIIANSHFTRDLLLDGGIAPDKIAVIHPGTDPSTFTPQPKNPEIVRQLGLDGKRVLLTVGRLSQRKGHDTTLRAMPDILRAVPNAVYLIAGQGEYDQPLRNLARSLRIDANVRFLSDVPADLLPAVYNLADLFVMPNRVLPDSNDVEGFGIVFLEAGACGKPVVGGHSGGVPDAIVDGQTGLLIDGADPDQLAAAAIRLLTDDTLASRMGHAARERICRRLTWDHSADQIRDWIAGRQPFILDERCDTSTQLSIASPIRPPTPCASTTTLV